MAEGGYLPQRLILRFSVKALGVKVFTGAAVVVEMELKVSAVEEVSIRLFLIALIVNSGGFLPVSCLRLHSALQTLRILILRP